MVRVSEGGKQLAFTDERVARKRSNDIPTDTSVKPLEEHSFRPFHHLTSPINSPFKTLASPESGPRACTTRLRHGVHVRGVAPNGATVRLKHGRFQVPRAVDQRYTCRSLQHSCVRRERRHTKTHTIKRSTTPGWGTHDIGSRKHCYFTDPTRIGTVNREPNRTVIR